MNYDSLFAAVNDEIIHELDHGNNRDLRAALNTAFDESQPNLTDAQRLKDLWVDFAVLKARLPAIIASAVTGETGHTR